MPVLLRGWDFVFLKAFVLLSAYSEQSKESCALKAPRRPSTKAAWPLQEARGGRASWLLPDLSGLPQITNFNPISPLQTRAWACQPERYLDGGPATAGLAVILDSSFPSIPRPNPSDARSQRSMEPGRLCPCLIPPFLHPDRTALASQ